MKRSAKGNDPERSGPDYFGFDDEPSAYFSDSRNKKRQTRALQLCKQVQRIVSCCLSGEYGDEILQSLFVESVVPAPDASRLMINVYPSPLMRKAGLEEILDRLSVVRPALRHEVARVVTRKRVPELVFNVVRGQGGES